MTTPDPHTPEEPFQFPLNASPFSLDFTSNSDFYELEDTPEGPHPLKANVMPILKQEDGSIKLIGTAFTLNGAVMMTAGHVAAVIRRLEQKIRAGSASVHVLYLARANPRRTQDGKPYVMLPFPVLDVSYNDISDVALLTVRQPLLDGKPPRLLATNLSLNPPLFDEPCFTIGYTMPEAPLVLDASGERKPTIEPKLWASQGIVPEIHLGGRDSAFNYPRFDIDARIDHQMSGGPIFSYDLTAQASCISAVASSGWTTQEGVSLPASAALLWSALGLTVPVTVPPTAQTERITLYEIARRGDLQIANLEAVTLSPDERTITLRTDILQVGRFSGSYSDPPAPATLDISLPPPRSLTLDEVLGISHLTLPR